MGVLAAPFDVVTTALSKGAGDRTRLSRIAYPNGGGGNPPFRGFARQS